MMVDATQAPHAAMWQGLMLIGVAIWALWLFSGSNQDQELHCHWFLAAWTVAVSVFVALM